MSGIPIVEGLSLGTAFSRVDLIVNRQTKRVIRSKLHAPRDICAYRTPDAHACAGEDVQESGVPVQYEGRPVSADPRIVSAMAPALARVRARQAVPLGVVLDTPIGREGDLESPLGNLFARAMRESTPGADLAINNNRVGGLRADLPAGPLTFGHLYDVFPFDDRLVQLTVTGAQLRAIFATDVRRERRGALGVSGISIRATCSQQGLQIELSHASGRPIADTDRLALVTTDLLVRGTVFASLTGPERTQVPPSAPIAREVVAAWLERRGGRLSAGEFFDPTTPHWHPFDAHVSRCVAARLNTR